MIYLSIIYVKILSVIGAMKKRIANTTFFIATITETFEAARDFQPLTTQLLLYGNEIVDNTLNSTLFRAVRDYIKSTKRFDNTLTIVFLFDLEI